MKPTRWCWTRHVLGTWRRQGESDRNGWFASRLQIGCRIQKGAHTYTTVRSVEKSQRNATSSVTNAIAFSDPSALKTRMRRHDGEKSNQSGVSGGDKEDGNGGVASRLGIGQKGRGEVSGALAGCQAWSLERGIVNRKRGRSLDQKIIYISNPRYKAM